MTDNTKPEALDVYIVEQPPGTKKQPEWALSALHHVATDSVLVPGAVFYGSDEAAMLVAGWEGNVRCAFHERHAFIDADFIISDRANDPDDVELATVMQTSVRRWAKEDGSCLAS